MAHESSEAKLQEAEQNYRQQLERLKSELSRNEKNIVDAGLSTSGTSTSGIVTMTEDLNGLDTTAKLYELNTEIIEFQTQLEQTMETLQQEIDKSDKLEAEVERLKVCLLVRAVDNLSCFMIVNLTATF